MNREDTIRMAREAGAWSQQCKNRDVDYVMSAESLERFAALVAAAERKRFYGQDKPDECAKGCPPNQICDYCQVVAPVKAMILTEREACAKVCDDTFYSVQAAAAIRARGTNHG